MSLDTERVGFFCSFVAFFCFVGCLLRAALVGWVVSSFSVVLL